MVEIHQVNGKIPDQLFGKHGAMTGGKRDDPGQGTAERGVAGSIGVPWAAKAGQHLHRLRDRR